MVPSVPRILVCWLGMTDIRASRGGEAPPTGRGGTGPIANALEARDFSEVIILSDQAKATNSAYGDWLEARGSAPVQFATVKLTSPTDFGEIHQAAVAAVEALIDKHGDEAPLTFHLSPGTPAMAAVWILLAKTRFPSAELIESSLEAGVKTVSVPFDISAEYLPDLLRKSDEDLQRLSQAQPEGSPEFEDIIHRCAQMTDLVQMAKLVAIRDVPVLILGESGTGKELFANAIHRSSHRRNKPFVAVNCGAIPRELVDAELFGHEKGAFTGADKTRIGHFEEANGGTLFLDEIGELPQEAQVKLLRVLQEGEVRRIGGAAKPRKVDVRIIAATHRNLLGDIESGQFREDLFYRIAVGVLQIPALRDRKGDLGLLIDGLLAQVNARAARQPGYVDKKLSPSARNLLLAHGWPGNVRELQNTLTRATIWSQGETVSALDMGKSLMAAPIARDRNAAEELGEGFQLTEFLAELEKKFVERAWEESGHKVKDAAKLLGFPNYQNFSDRMKKYGLKR